MDVVGDEQGLCADKIAFGNFRFIYFRRTQHHWLNLVFTQTLSYMTELSECSLFLIFKKHCFSAQMQQLTFCGYLQDLIARRVSSIISTSPTTDLRSYVLVNEKVD